MKFYYKYITTYHNNVPIGTTMFKTLLDKTPSSETINLNWENLDKYYYKNGLSYKFNVYNLKKGRKISFFTNKFFLNKDERDVKEWKEELNIQIKITYKEYSPCIDEILKWHDTEKAIAYLNERGLKIK